MSKLCFCIDYCISITSARAPPPFLSCSVPHSPSLSPALCLPLSPFAFWLSHTNFFWFLFIHSLFLQIFLMPFLLCICLSLTPNFPPLSLFSLCPLSHPSLTPLSPLSHSSFNLSCACCFWGLFIAFCAKTFWTDNTLSPSLTPVTPPPPSTPSLNWV